MEKTIILILFLIAYQVVYSQLAKMQIVDQPKQLDSEFIAKRDANGDYCAVIKVISNLDGLRYDSNNGIVEVENNPSEDIVYISSNEKVLIVYHSNHEPKKIILHEEGIYLKPSSAWQIKLISSAHSKNLTPSSKNVGRLKVNIKPSDANAYFKIEGMPFTGKYFNNGSIISGNDLLNNTTSNNLNLNINPAKPHPDDLDPFPK